MPFKPHPFGVTITIRLTPGARKTGFNGIADIGDGKKAVKVSVNAVPEDGKANAALLTFLSKSWAMPKSALSLLSGDTHRTKVVLAEGDANTLMERIKTGLQ